MPAPRRRKSNARYQCHSNTASQAHFRESDLLKIIREGSGMLRQRLIPVYEDVVDVEVHNKLNKRPLDAGGGDVLPLVARIAGEDAYSICRLSIGHCRHCKGLRISRRRGAGAEVGGWGHSFDAPERVFKSAYQLMSVSGLAASLVWRIAVAVQHRTLIYFAMSGAGTLPRGASEVRRSCFVNATY